MIGRLLPAGVPSGPPAVPFRKPATACPGPLPCATIRLSRLAVLSPAAPVRSHRLPSRPAQEVPRWRARLQ